MGTNLTAIDRTSDDAIANWWAQCTNVTADEREMTIRLHRNSQGLNRLDRWLGAKMTTPANLQHPKFGMNFATYAGWCSKLRTAPKGRVLVALMSCRFKIGRERCSVINMVHFYKIELESFKLQDVQTFVQPASFSFSDQFI